MKPILVIVWVAKIFYIKSIYFQCLQNGLFSKEEDSVIEAERDWHWCCLTLSSPWPLCLRQWKPIWRPIIGPFPLFNGSINCFRLVSAVPSLFFLLSFLSFSCPSFFFPYRKCFSPPQSFHSLYKYLVHINVTNQAFLGSVFKSEHRGITLLTGRWGKTSNQQIKESVGIIVYADEQF